MARPEQKKRFILLSMTLQLMQQFFKKIRIGEGEILL